MNNQKINTLIQKYIKGTASSFEKAQLLKWYRHTAYQDAEIPDDEELTYSRMLSRLNQSIHPTAKKQSKYRYWLAAASVVIASITVGYFLLQKTPKPAQITRRQVSQDLLPGSNKAILTLSNGKKVSLTDAKTGLIAKDANLIVNKSADGSITYRDNQSDIKNRDVAYQTIETPKGGQWPAITLPDGTKALLDAGSSITYPLAFNKNERKVHITGQVYFEVVHNADKPFRVVVKGQTIEDIGTQFNVNAYDDEPAVKTTLIEGSVSIAKQQYKAILTPGQQAIIKDGDNNITVKQANLQETMAWKKGLFYFDHADLQSAMRQISRWYNVQVVYEGNIPNTMINGEMYRNMKASQVFDGLNYLKVNFRIDGNKIIVTNK